MGAEMPALSAVVARLPQPEIHLAAYGGIVFPIALIIESPVIMLLAASTALSKDWPSYRRIYRFMMLTGAVMTGLHILLAFTPLYDFVVNVLIQTPPEIVEPGRVGLRIMLPWTWCIAYRRFNQGVMIRFGYSQKVGIGTAIRLTTDLIVLLIGYRLGLPGIVVGAGTVAAGVLSEAIYAGLAVRPVLRNDLKNAPIVEPALNLRTFLKFYVPLALTSLIQLIANPLGSMGLSRMPLALQSLAVWSVITGLIFMLRSMGIALNEVVVALLDEKNSSTNLYRFTLYLSGGATLFLLLVAATPLSDFWFSTVSALEPDLAQMARLGLWIALPLPALSALQSWYQGALLYGKNTGHITVSVVIYLLTSLVVLVVGILYQRTPGLYFGLAALTISVLTQTAWLWYTSRPVITHVRKRDQLSQASAISPSLD